jgi:hypothetical protein
MCCGKSVEKVLKGVEKLFKSVEKVLNCTLFQNYKKCYFSLIGTVEKLLKNC